MATFKCVIFRHHRRPDGSYPVKLRVTHNRVSRFLPTNLIAYPDELTRSLKPKPGELLHKCNDLIRDCQLALRRATSATQLPSLTCDEVVDAVKADLGRESWRLDFFAFAQSEYIPAPSMGLNYATALHALERYLGCRRLDVNEITAGLLQGFVEYIEVEPKQAANRRPTTPAKKAKQVGASRRYLSLLATIFYAAQRKYNDDDRGVIRIPRSPFQRVDAPRPVHEGQRSLGVEGIQKIIDYEPRSSTDQFARDLFLVSFALMGVNLADLYKATPPKLGVWRYSRSKISGKAGKAARMEVRVPAEIAPELARLTVAPAPGKWLNLSRRAASKNYITANVSRSLARIATELGMEPFTLYAARHSWATIARSKAGIDKATVDECLVHVGDYRMADIYVEKDFDILNEANAKVLALFRWKNLDI